MNPYDYLQIKAADFLLAEPRQGTGGGGSLDDLQGDIDESGSTLSNFLMGIGITLAVVMIGVVGITAVFSKKGLGAIITDFAKPLAVILLVAAATTALGYASNIDLLNL